MLLENDLKSLARQNVQRGNGKKKKKRLRYDELLFGGLMSFECFIGKLLIIVLQVMRDAIVSTLLYFVYLW